MDRPFVKFRNYIINLEAVACIETTEDGGDGHHGDEPRAPDSVKFERGR